MQYIIPLEAIPNQSFSIEIEEKTCDFEFITRGAYIYMNLKIDNEDVLNGVICYSGTNLNLYDTTGLKGKIYFKDTQGNLDPVYYGLNDRWLLIYED